MVGSSTSSTVSPALDRTVATSPFCSRSRVHARRAILPVALGIVRTLPGPTERIRYSQYEALRRKNGQYRLVIATHGFVSSQGPGARADDAFSIDLTLPFRL